MARNRIALITGANTGMGEHVARELVAAGLTVFVGSRDLERGRAAAAAIGDEAIAVQLEVTDSASIAAAAEAIRVEVGRLDVLVNNAAISSTRSQPVDLAELFAGSVASRASLDEIRAVWEVNALGPLAVYQAMLPLLQHSPDARIVNVTSAMGSLGIITDAASGLGARFEPVYSASKTALNALTLSMMNELAGTPVKVNLVSPGFANTALVNFQGTESVADAAREIVRVALLGPDGPTGTFTTWEGIELPW